MAFAFPGLTSSKPDSFPPGKNQTSNHISQSHHHHSHGHHNHSHVSSARQSTEETRDMAFRASEVSKIPTKDLVIPDPVALKYLSDDPYVNIVEPRTTLEGYELYLVEQWACSRQSPSTVIASYTGDPKSVIVVGVISVPQDESIWSIRLKIFLQAIQQFHARPRETCLGDLITTNLSSFPSALTAILIPGGDVRKYQKIFYVNENLKRMGCSGRAGLTLNDPTPATQAKFYSMYRIHERINFAEAVIEIVRMCQLALVIFGQLESVYIDGLLCDITETSISNWWTDIGVEYYNIEPSDGILGPTTVSAILGTLMGARNRLNSYGATVPKDAFEIEAMARGISQFQKYQKVKRTGILDRDTLMKLQSATAKAAANEGWAVQRAVKSTVAEIGGKRGELVMGMVGGRDKGGISEIETLDYEKFISYVYGELPKWLWHGKTRRSVVENSHDKHAEIGSAQMAAKEQQQLATISTNQRLGTLPFGEDSTGPNSKEDLHIISSQTAIAGPFSPTQTLQESPNDKSEKTRFKSVAGRMNDARSGLGRIKDAVGGGRKGAKSGQDEFGEPMSSPPLHNAPSGFKVPARAFTWSKTPEAYLNGVRRDKANETRVPMVPLAVLTEFSLEKQLNGKAESIEDESEYIRSPSVTASVTATPVDRGQWLDETEAATSSTRRFHRRHSVHVTSERPPRHEARWPRRSSFSLAADAILQWEEIAPMFELLPSSSQTGCLLELARVFCRNVSTVKSEIEPWADEKLRLLTAVHDRFATEEQEIRTLREQVADDHANIVLSAKEIITKERGDLMAALKEVETLLARLDYEIKGLGGLVVDVEEGVQTFERQVRKLEDRADELRIQLQTESWMHWLVRTITGIGTGPNILKDSAKKTQ